MIVGYFAFCALFLLSRYVLFPNIAQYKSEIESAISKSLGRDISISRLSASWSGLNPHLALGNVLISDQLGKNVLALPDVNVTLSWWSLVLLDLRFDQIELIRPRLNVMRDATGKLYVAGFLVDTKKDTDGKGLEWVLAQHNIVVREGRVTWNDHLRSAPELTLSDVHFRLSNRWRSHHFALNATPPASLVAPVDIRGNFQHPAFTKKVADLSNWTGDIYADFRQVDLMRLGAYVAYPGDLQKGFGTLRSWIRMDRGRVADFTADIHLVDVLGRFRENLPILDMTSVSGRLIASERLAAGIKYLPALFGQSGHSIALVNFSMQARDGSSLPATTIRENFIPGENGQPGKIELYAKFLDLHALGNFAQHLPLPDDQRQLLSDLAPRGQLREFSAKWQGSYPDVASYSMKGQFVGLSMKPQAAQSARTKSANQLARAAFPAIPGFENLTGSINASDKGGKFTLDSSDVSLQLPGYFVDPVMPFSRLHMAANWTFGAQDKLLFKVDKMEFAQAGLKGAFSGKHILSLRRGEGGALGELDITGKISGFDVRELGRYLPVQTPEDLRHWLLTALQRGRADDVQIKVRGDLAHFPFSSKEGNHAGKGEFLVKGNIVDGKLDFAPGQTADNGKSPLWPVIENIKGSFVFDRSRMEIRADTATTLLSDLRKVKAVIPDLLSQNPVLSIEGAVTGGLQGMLNYVVASPVDSWLGQFLHETKATSGAQLGLKLQLPLNSLAESRVQGSLQFANNDAVLQPGIPLISGIAGSLDFDEKGVNLTTLKGSFLGGAVVASGGTQKDGNIRIRLDGVATAEGLNNIFLNTAVDPLTKKMSGSARYSAQINVVKQQPELIIDSSLIGLSLDLPAPLHKTGMQNMPLHFEVRPTVSFDSALMSDHIKLTLGSVINGQYQRQKHRDAMANWQVLRGGIGVNLPAPEPDSGLHANIEIDSLSVDAWSRLLGKKNVAVENLASNQLHALPEVDLSAFIQPNSLSAQTKELYVADKKLENVVLGASHQKGLWQANIDSRQVSGHISWNDTSAGLALDNVTARLSKLIIPQNAASAVTDLLEGKNTSTHIPSLDIVAENFELFNKKLGRLELLATNLPTTSGREWHINKLSLKNDDGALKATGSWTSGFGEGKTHLNCVLDVLDAGKMLDRLGFVKEVRAGRGKLAGDLSWHGPPFAPEIASMNGQLTLDMTTGQFLKIEPGAANLFGMLSLQALARRFTFDFRDVFSEGFAFDSMNGTAKIEQGTVTTNNFKIRSLNATVLMDGSADLLKKTQELHVVMIPKLNAGTTSVVLTAINPVIGLSAFLAELYLREPVARAFSREYQLSGTWTDPSVTQIHHAQTQTHAIETQAKQVKAIEK